MGVPLISQEDDVIEQCLNCGKLFNLAELAEHLKKCRYLFLLLFIIYFFFVSLYIFMLLDKQTIKFRGKIYSINKYIKSIEIFNLKYDYYTVYLKSILLRKSHF